MEYTMGSYQVAVIGAGHAGIEAACAAARFWRKTSSARAYQRAFGSFLSIFVPLFVACF